MLQIRLEKPGTRKLKTIKDEFEEVAGFEINPCQILPSVRAAYCSINLLCINQLAARQSKFKPNRMRKENQWKKQKSVIVNIFFKRCSIYCAYCNKLSLYRFRQRKYQLLQTYIRPVPKEMLRRRHSNMRCATIETHNRFQPFSLHFSLSLIVQGRNISNSTFFTESPGSPPRNFNACFPSSVREIIRWVATFTFRDKSPILRQGDSCNSFYRRKSLLQWIVVHRNTQNR